MDAEAVEEVQEALPIPEEPGGAVVRPFSPSQHNVYAAVHAAFVDYQINLRLPVTVLYLSFIPISTVVFAVVAFLVMLAAYGVFVAVDQVAGGGATWLLYLALAVVFAFAKVIQTNPEGPVRFSPGHPSRLWLGRLDEYFGGAAPTTYGSLLGAVFGIQVGLVYLTPNHAGIETSGTLSHCFLVSLDNLCHGVFLDTCELYNLYFTNRITHNWFSATVFYILQLGYDVLAALILYEIYQRFRVYRLLRGYPSDARRPGPVIGWIEKTCASPEGWMRQFCDEFLFLLLVTHYLRGNFDIVRELSRQFSWICVSDHVRAMFVDHSGKVIFAGAPARENSK
jgi:hypothetical protein